MKKYKRKNTTLVLEYKRKTTTFRSKEKKSAKYAIQSDNKFEKKNKNKQK